MNTHQFIAAFWVVFLSLSSSSVFASTRYKVAAAGFSKAYSNYRPQGFVVDAVTGQKIPNRFYGLATDGKGEVVGVQIGSQGDILEFREVADGETGHVAGGTQNGGGTSAVVSFNAIDGKPDHASFYCLPEIGDEVVVALKTAGGTRSVAYSYSVMDGNADGKPDWNVIVGASENAQGKMVPVLWHGPIGGCASPDSLAVLPLPSSLAAGADASGRALGFVAKPDGTLEIVGVISGKKGDALVLWKWSGKGGVVSEVVAFDKGGLQIGDVFSAASVGQDLGIIGSNPEPFVWQRNAVGEWGNIILSWDGTSMATPHFMDYTYDSPGPLFKSVTSSSTASSSFSKSAYGPYMAGGSAFVIDRTYDYEIAVLWKGMMSFTGSDEELGALVKGQSLDVNLLADAPAGFGFVVRDVVDADPATGALLVKTSDASGNTGAAILAPGSGLVPEILHNNLTAETVEGPYGVWNQGVDKYVSQKTGSAGKFQQTIDVTANFMDYTYDSAVSLDVTISGYATFPSSNKTFEATAMVIYIDETGGVIEAGLETLTAGEFAINMSGLKPPPDHLGVLKLGLRVTASENQKFGLKINEFVVKTF